MTHIPTRSDFAKVDAFEESRRLARRPWSVRRTASPFAVFALVLLALLGIGYAGAEDFRQETARYGQGDLGR